jgi:hypothetical protein
MYYKYRHMFKIFLFLVYILLIVYLATMNHTLEKFGVLGGRVPISQSSIVEGNLLAGKHDYYGNYNMSTEIFGIWYS